tara:strand:+ start:498 stop:1607 length:1110 start_codon:yes stop_codon:yes gene_type:complete
LLLNSLEVDHLRNLTTARLELCSGFNLIEGPNGAGKTTLLEAIHLLARGKSFRSSKISNLVQRNERLLRVRAQVMSGDGRSHILALEKQLGGDRALRLDGQEAKSAAALASFLPIQLLLPNVGDLIFSGPSDRREFLDWGLFHVKQDYVRLAREYRKILRQRNAWLRREQVGPDEQDPWLAMITESGQRIGALRQDYLADLTPLFCEMLSRLDPSLECVLDYQAGGYAKNIAETRKKMAETKPRDVKSGSTQMGPHRADVAIQLAQASAQETASRGQGKTIGSAAALAQSALLAKHTGQPSVVLIDDFGAELDSAHRSRLLQALLAIGCQVVATSTEPLTDVLDGLSKEHLRVFHVEHGSVHVSTGGGF